MSCRYCGRQSQTPGRSTCDGCAAPLTSNARAASMSVVRAKTSVGVGGLVFSPGALIEVHGPGLMVRDWRHMVQIKVGD